MTNKSLNNFDIKRSTYWLTLAMLLASSLSAIIPPFLFDHGTDYRSLILVFLVTVLAARSIYRGNNILALFNSSTLFLLIIPFVIQYSLNININGNGSEINRLSNQTTIYFALFMLCVNLVAITYKRNGISHLLVSVKDFSWTFCIFSNVVVFFTIIYFFGIDYILTSRFDQLISDTSLVSSSVIILDMLRFAPYVLAYSIAARSIENDSKLGIKFLAALLVAIFISNPLNSPRFICLTGLFFCFCPILFRYKMINVVPVLFPLLALLILPITSMLRYGLDDNISNRVSQIFYSSEFSALQVLNDGFYYLSDEPLGFGEYIISGLLIWIPRSIWENKNDGTGITIGSLGYYPEDNVGVPPFFDAYLDFGFPGVVIFGIFIGLLLKSANSWSNFGSLFGTFKRDLYMMLFALIPIFVRGDFMTVCRACYTLTISYVIINLVYNLRSWLSLGANTSIRRTKILKS